MPLHDKKNGVNAGEFDSKEQKISCLEEAILRMRYGLSGDGAGRAAYEKKPVDEEAYQRLLALELRALQEAGRLSELLDSSES